MNDDDDHDHDEAREAPLDLDAARERRAEALAQEVALARAARHLRRVAGEREVAGQIGLERAGLASPPDDEPETALARRAPRAGAMVIEPGRAWEPRDWWLLAIFGAGVAGALAAAWWHSHAFGEADPEVPEIVATAVSWNFFSPMAGFGSRDGLTAAERLADLQEAQETTRRREAAERARRSPRAPTDFPIDDFDFGIVIDDEDEDSNPIGDLVSREVRRQLRRAVGDGRQANGHDAETMAAVRAARRPAAPKPKKRSKKAPSGRPPKAPRGPYERR